MLRSTGEGKYPHDMAHARLAFDQVTQPLNDKWTPFSKQTATGMLSEIRAQPAGPQRVAACNRAAQRLWPSLQPQFQRWYAPSAGGAWGKASLGQGAGCHKGVTCPGPSERVPLYTSQAIVDVCSALKWLNERGITACPWWTKQEKVPYFGTDLLSSDDDARVTDVGVRPDSFVSIFKDTRREDITVGEPPLCSPTVSVMNLQLLWPPSMLALANLATPMGPDSITLQVGATLKDLKEVVLNRARALAIPKLEDATASELSFIVDRRMPPSSGYAETTKRLQAKQAY